MSAIEYASQKDAAVAAIMEKYGVRDFADVPRMNTKIPPDVIHTLTAAQRSTLQDIYMMSTSMPAPVNHPESRKKKDKKIPRMPNLIPTPTPETYVLPDYQPASTHGWQPLHTTAALRPKAPVYSAFSRQRHSSSKTLPEKLKSANEARVHEQQQQLRLEQEYQQAKDQVQQRYERDLVQLNARRDNDMTLLAKQHEPLIQKLKMQIEEVNRQVRDLDLEMQDWERDLGTKDIPAITPLDVMTIAARIGADYSADLIQSHNVNGELFASCDDEGSISKYLGIKEIGDRYRLISVAESLAEKGKCLLPPVFACDVDNENPRKWSINQAAQWAESTTIVGLGDKFRKHKIAGDLLFLIEPKAFCAIMEVLGPDKAKFMTKLKELRDDGGPPHAFLMDPNLLLMTSPPSSDV